MANPVLLLGAGASVDAGLPNAFDLTEQIYNHLVELQRDEAKLFAYVIAKLLTRQTRRGASPFSRLNVEEVYDALKRYLARDEDVISEFVFSWDPVSISGHHGFNSQMFADQISGAFSLSRRHDRIQMSIDRSKLASAANTISNAFTPNASSSNVEDALRPYLQVLVHCLKSNNETYPYLTKLVNFCRGRTMTVATLNYDTLLETCFRHSAIDFDYGLGAWNNRRYVRFPQKSMKLIKLHGSVNWYENGDDVSVVDEGQIYLKRGMIFGGQGDKLVSHGPYLQLRHEFQRALNDTNVFGIIGYSFQDRHLNALIRAWVSSRRKAKMVILDPGIPRLGADVLGRAFLSDKDGKPVRYKVEFDHISARAAQGMDQFLESLETPPNPPSLQMVS